MADQIGVRTSPLTGTIYVGRISKKDPRVMLSRREAEPEVIQAVILHILHDIPKGAIKTVSLNGGETTYEITVRPVKE